MKISFRVSGERNFFTLPFIGTMLGVSSDPEMKFHFGLSYQNEFISGSFATRLVKKNFISPEMKFSCKWPLSLKFLIRISSGISFIL